MAEAHGKVCFTSMPSVSAPRFSMATALDAVPAGCAADEGPDEPARRQQRPEATPSQRDV
jgi:hypothetical protein